MEMIALWPGLDYGLAARDPGFAFVLAAPVAFVLSVSVCGRYDHVADQSAFLG